MVQIYSPDNTNYDLNGDMTLQPVSCLAYAELNGMWYLELTHLIDEEGRWKYIVEEAVVKVKTWQQTSQLFRIQKVTKKDTRVTAEAYPIFYDARDDGFIITKHPVNKNGNQALQIMLSDLPAKYSGSSNITTAATAYFENRNLIDCLCGESPNFVERWGGEIRYNNYAVEINTRIGSDRLVDVRYGKNIRGITYEVDMSEIATRIYPQSYNGHRMYGETPWVDSPLINSYAKLYVKKIEYEHVRMAEDVTGEEEEDLIVCETQEELDAALRQCCQDDFAAGIDKPKVTMDIDLINLADTVEYSDYVTLETIRLGDTVHCIHSKLGITSDARVISIEYDCLTNRTTRIQIGDATYDYIRNMSTAVSRINGVIRSDGSLVADRVAGFLDGAKTSLRAQYDIARRQDVLAILFENLDTESPLYGATAIGTQGFMISKTRNGDDTGWIWTTAGTSNGFVADTIVAGLLSDKLGKNYWDLDTGNFRLSAEATVGDQSLTEFITNGILDNLLLDTVEFTQQYWSIDSSRGRASLVIGQTDPYGGTKAIKLVKPASGENETYIFPNTTTNFPFSRHTEYVFSVWLRSSANASTPLKLFCNGQVLEVYPTTSWREYKLTCTYTGTSSGTVAIGGGGSYTSSSNYTLYIFCPRVAYASWFETQQGVFNLLTKNGSLQGLFMQDGQLYINANMINAGLLKGNLIDAKNLVVRDGSNKVTLNVDSNGNVSMDVSSLKVSGETIDDIAEQAAIDHQKTYNQQEIFNILTNNGTTSGIFLVNGELYINGDFISVADLRAIVAKIGGFDIDANEICSVGANNTTGNLHMYADGRMSFGGTYTDCQGATDFTSQAYPYLDTTGFFHQMVVRDGFQADFVYIDRLNTDSQSPHYGYGLYVENDAYYGSAIHLIGNLYYWGTLINRSDRRLKENIEDADGSADLVRKLRVRSFDWKDTKAHVNAGLIAQEMQEVMPDLVEEGKDGYLYVNYTGIIPHLVEAWQESEKKVDALSTEVESLKAEIGELKYLLKRVLS